MNSPTDKPQKSPPAAQQMQINPEVLALLRQKILLARTIWWLLRNPEKIKDHSAVIDDDEIPPLWDLGTGQNDLGHLNLLARLLPDLTDTQVQNTVEFLLGTKEPLTAAIEKLKLPQPIAYIEAAIRDYAVMADGVWMHPDLATAKGHPPGQ